MKKHIKAILRNCEEQFMILRARKCEINKFRDPRRVNIYKDIKFTSEQKNDIDNMYKNHYGKRIPYTWHRHYTAFTGKFDHRYFPELLYIPEFEYFMTPHQEYCYAFADKNVISIIAGYAGVKTPEVILSKTAGVYKDSDGKPLSFKQSLNKIAGEGYHVCQTFHGLVQRYWMSDTGDEGRIRYKNWQFKGGDFECFGGKFCHSKSAQMS